MTPRLISPTDATWLLLESRDTPMHVGGLFEFTPPADAPARLPQERARADARVARRSRRRGTSSWSTGPLVGPRLPLMREDHDVDLDYHVRHSALPYPGGQRELGILVSRLHSHQLDLHRPLWEVHLIEGLEGNRFAIYLKMHHSLIDGVSGMRLILRALSTDPGRARERLRSGPSGRAAAAPSSDQAANGSGLIGSAARRRARDAAAR